MDLDQTVLVLEELIPCQGLEVPVVEVPAARLPLEIEVLEVASAYVDSAGFEPREEDVVLPQV